MNFVAKTRALLESMAPQTEAADKPVDKAHFCATHVEHSIYGMGRCISENHAEPDVDGNIAWYNVEFEDGIHRVDTAALKILQAENHTHGKKKAMKEEEEQIEEVEQVEEAQTSAAARYAKAKMSHQAKTTMKHVDASSASPQVKQAIAKASKDIKPGVSGYGDRAAALSAAGIQREETEQVDEKLHPNQDKHLDVVDDDKIDAKDFAKLRAMKKDMKESVIEVTTMLEHTATISIPAEPTFGDYLNAVKSMVANPDNDDKIESEIVALAQEAFDNAEIDVLINAKLSEADYSTKIPTASGMKVMGHRYGNSAEAERNRTKKFVDTVKGPSQKAMDKLATQKTK